MKTSLTEMLQRIPGAATARWPDGDRYAEGLRHGTMSFGVYAPRGHDPQQPHAQDELYVIHAGTGDLVIGEQRHAFAPGDVFFVAAGVTHRFERFSDDFTAWVVFWGPAGGEGVAAPAMRPT
jgi:mannose-6-phosphate isomerase-like protein (cupin superfamily)